MPLEVVIESSVRTITTSTSTMRESPEDGAVAGTLDAAPWPKLLWLPKPLPLLPPEAATNPAWLPAMLAPGCDSPPLAL